MHVKYDDINIKIFANCKKSGFIHKKNNNQEFKADIYSFQINKIIFNKKEYIIDNDNNLKEKISNIDTSQFINDLITYFSNKEIYYSRKNSFVFLL